MTVTASFRKMQHIRKEIEMVTLNRSWSSAARALIEDEQKLRVWRIAADTYVRTRADLSHIEGCALATRDQMIHTLLRQQRAMFEQEPESADFPAAEEYYRSLSDSALCDECMTH